MHITILEFVVGRPLNIPGILQLTNNRNNISGGGAKRFIFTTHSGQVAIGERVWVLCIPRYYSQDYILIVSMYVTCIRSDCPDTL